MLFRSPASGVWPCRISGATPTQAKVPRWETGYNSGLEQKTAMMNGYNMGWGMGFGWIWMAVTLVVVGLAIAALLKYLRK